MAVIVFAAFFASGGLNAGTPLAIASTPVSATEPPAKALSSNRIPSVSVPNGRASGSGGTGPAVPVAIRNAPIPTIARAKPDEEVGRHREDVPRLAQAAQVRDRDERDRDEGDLDPDVVRGRDDRLDLRDRRGRRDRHGHDVVDEQRRGGDQPEDRREVRARDDVRATTVRVRPADLPVRHRDHGQQDRDRDRRPGSRGAGRAAPATIRTRRISSVAYADELMASELKIARAFFLDRRSPISSSFASGRPKTTWRMRATARPGRRPRYSRPLRARPARRARRSGSTGECGRSTRTRRSPDLRPLSCRRPPITGGLPDSRSMTPQPSRRGPMRRLTAPATALDRCNSKLTPAAWAWARPRAAARSAASRPVSWTTLARPDDDELDRDIDLAERHVERIRLGIGRGLRPDFMHVSNVRGSPKREPRWLAVLPLNNPSTSRAEPPQGSRIRYPTPGSAVIRSCIVPVGSAAASLRRSRLT